jgi:hypothetical protein
MNVYRLLPRFVILASLAAAIGATGCKSTPPATPVPVAGQSNPAAPLNSDGTPANTAPAPSTAPTVATTPVQPAVAPVPAPLPPPKPVALVAPSGTRVVIRTNETLSAGKNEVGDAFSGELEEPIVSHGATLFRRGTHVSGTVVAAKGRGRFKGEGAIGIEISSIGSVRVHTSEYEKASKGKGKRTGALIGGGAGLGALIGGLAGGGKGAVIGGLAGAGAGTAGAAYTGNKDVVIPSESVLTFSLLEPLRVQP